MPGKRNKKNDMSDKRQPILDYITSYQREHGYAPSFAEIKQALKISSTNVISENIDRLIKEGKLEKTYYVARSLRVVDAQLVNQETADALNALKAAAKPFVSYFNDLIVGVDDEAVISVRANKPASITAGDVRRLQELVEGVK